MSDSGGNTPFSSFPRFSPNVGDEMFDSLLKLMRMPGGLASDGGLASPPLGLGPDIVAPLMGVEELDKRITDLQAVEQWLKLNLSMLQSTIQALQTQRSTFATLRAFGAFAQASMTPTPGGAPADRRAPDTSRGEAADAAAAADAGERAAASSAGETLDASVWWSWLQTQFEQIARFAVAPHTMPGASVPVDDIEEAIRQRGDEGLGRLPADRPTDQPTNRPTDQPTERTHLGLLSGICPRMAANLSITNGFLLSPKA